MAHRGRNYPVAFRRDFNFNSDIGNQFSLADEYFTTLHDLFGNPYPVNGHTFHLLQLPQPDVATLAWGETDVHIGPDLWSIRLRVDYPELPDTVLRATWFLFKYEFLASSWRGVPKDRMDPLNTGTLVSQVVLFTDFSVFANGANFNGSNPRPAGYPP